MILDTPEAVAKFTKRRWEVGRRCVCGRGGPDGVGSCSPQGTDFLLKLS